MSLARDWKTAARNAGFDLVGICPAVTPHGVHRLYQWLELGYHGAMDYVARRVEAYAHPRYVLPGARSLLMVALRYSPHSHQNNSHPENEPGHGRVSTYAAGERDYHDVIHERLDALVSWIRDAAPGCTARGVVDSAPLMEREFAQLAGLGWRGKNTLLINRQLGSWFFLAAVLTDKELDYDEPFTADHCGTCTACLDACPTQAFPQPYLLDSRRCISYLTIELREMIPESLRSPIGDWIFGCDICQQVCPWNRRAEETEEPALQSRDEIRSLDLQRLFELDDDGFRSLFRGTPLWRAKRRGILRNAAVVLGNQANATALPALLRGLGDGDALVRATCVWAVAQCKSSLAISALEGLRGKETDPLVLHELRVLDSLASHQRGGPHPIQVAQPHDAE